MGHQASRGAQEQVTVADPCRLRGHLQQQSTGTFAFVLFLEGAAVIPRLAQNPAIISFDQEALDQHLGERRMERVFGEQG